MSGHCAPSYDQVDNRVSVIDRAVIGVEHFFPHWPIDGKVVFDPEGIVSTWPVCFDILLGALAGIVHARGLASRPALAFVVAGVALMAFAHAIGGVIPIIKNIRTSSFAIFSGGFALTLLAYILVFLMASSCWSAIAGVGS